MVPEPQVVTVRLEGEDAYFKKKEVELIQALREKSAKEKSQEYAAAHRNHCFRCGSTSLVEVEHGKVKVDVCVNQGCGAVHLDPGELNEILKNQSALGRVRQALLACFE